MQPSGGANSGVLRDMTQAGKGKVHDTVGTFDDSSITIPANWEATQRDTSRSICANSVDKLTWEKLGPLPLDQANDGDLAEWMIGKAIEIKMIDHFWKKVESDNNYYTAHCYDTLIHNNKKKPAEVRLFISQQSKQNRKDVRNFTSEILISADLTSQDRKLKLNNLRQAIRETYGNSPTLTLNDIYEMHVERTRRPGEGGKTTTKSSKGEKKTADNSTASPAASEPDSDSGEAEASSSSDPTPKTRTSTRTAKHKSHQTVADKMARNWKKKTDAYLCMDDGTHKSFKLNPKQAAMTGMLAAAAICAMAETHGYKPEFLPPEPKNQRDAHRRPDAHRWKKAEVKELDTLWEMGTFEIVDRDPNKKYDPLPVQFVYKLKVVDGNFDEGTPKARLVIMGNLQYEWEYGETYAPTAKLWAIRTLTSIAAQEGLQMKKFDLTGAFLVADMDTELYVEIPGYEVPEGKMLRLRKALYGGKSSGALYAQEIKGWLTEYGFQPTSVDETLFRLTRVKNNKTSTLLVSLYVDDGACCTNDDELYQEFITALSNKYKLSDSGDLKWHLGMKVTQDHENGTISMDQTAYIDNVVKRFNMEGANDKHTPLPPGEHLTAEDCPQVPIKADVKLYQQLVGSLMYVACGTRPDIAYAVNTCAQYMSNPGQSHLKAAKHILRYLKTTREAKLTYRRQRTGKGNKLYGYVDADHAGCRDDRKSVGGYVLMLNGGAISWSSRKIKVVSISSFESEWYSASIAGCEIVVVRRLLEEIERAQTEPTILFEDNAACIISSKTNQPMQPRSKHIDVRIFKLKEFVQDKVLTLEKVASIDNIADCLTKPLARDSVTAMRKYMLGEIDE